MNIGATANYEHERNPYYDDAYANERERMPENNN